MATIDALTSGITSRPIAKSDRVIGRVFVHDHAHDHLHTKLVSRSSGEVRFLTTTPLVADGGTYYHPH